MKLFLVVVIIKYHILVCVQICSVLQSYSDGLGSILTISLQYETIIMDSQTITVQYGATNHYRSRSRQFLPRKILSGVWQHSKPHAAKRAIHMLPCGRQVFQPSTRLKRQQELSLSPVTSSYHRIAPSLSPPLPFLSMEPCFLPSITFPTCIVSCFW